MGVARVNKFLIAVMAFGMAGPASAIMVNFSVDGTIDAANTGNGFGLSAGDSVSMTGTFEADSLPVDGVVAFNEGTGNSLTITLGDIVLTESMDELFSDDFWKVPALGFSSGSLVSTDMIMTLGTNDSPVNFGTDFSGGTIYGTLAFEGDDGDYGGIWGHWLSDTLSVWSGETGSGGSGGPLQVPEPATFWLLGGSLLGFFGFRRRTRA